MCKPAAKGATRAESLLLGAALALLVGASSVKAQDPSTDLSVTMSASPDSVAGGANLTYTVTVTGPASATGVSVWDVLPPGVTYVSGKIGSVSCDVPNQPATAGLPGATVVCQVGNLIAGSATVTIVVKAPSITGAITNIAGVIGDQFDANMSNNSAVVTTTVTGGACGITSVTPNAGPVTGGTNVTILGSCFTGTTDVQFQSAFPTPSWHVDTDTQITATTPGVPSVCGAVDVRVVKGPTIYTLTGGYTYYCPPTVSSFDPSSGSTAGGTTVTITGTNLSGATVTFDGTLGNKTANSSSQVTVTTPAHASGAVNMVVSTPGGSVTRTYTYTGGGACGIASITPNAGPVTGGTNVTILGSCFTGTTDVQFQSAFPTPSWHVDTDTQITATTPGVPSVCGAVDVRVVKGPTIYTLSGGYTYYCPPTVSSFSPSSGSTAGGTTVTITGTNLSGATVTFDGTLGNRTANSSSQVTVTTPAHASGAVNMIVSTPGGSVTRSYTYTGAGWTFTDDPIVARQTTVKAIHIVELRQDVDVLRGRVGLGGAPWHDSIVSGGVVKAIHIQDLRTYLDDVLVRLGYGHSPYTDPNLTTGDTIRAIHIQELRQRIRNVPN